MSLDGFLFSLERALQSRWVRIAGSAIFFVLGVTTAWCIKKLFPLRDSVEGLVTHQSVYVGIDRLGAWSSLLWIMGLWWALALGAMLSAVLVHARDRVLAYAIFLFVFAWSVLIAFSFINLTLTNV
jgi:hypothetical protein